MREKTGPGFPDREPIKVVVTRAACQTRLDGGRMDEIAFLERRFALDGGALVVRFYTPFEAPGGEFRCRYSIGWPEREAGRHACGLDGVQALMLAMRTVHTELVGSGAYKAGRLTWCDQADLDLPPTWGDGSLYDAPSRPDEDVPPQPT